MEKTAVSGHILKPIGILIPSVRCCYDPRQHIPSLASAPLYLGGEATFCSAHAQKPEPHLPVKMRENQPKKYFRKPLVVLRRMS